MTTLTTEARNTIKWHREGMTIAGYTRHYFPDGAWRGDRCGCVDDRCIGFHHDETETCNCLPAWLDQYYVEVLAPERIVLEVTGDGRAEWLGRLGTEVKEIGIWASRADAERARANWEALGYTASVKVVTRTGHLVAAAERDQAS